MTRSNVFAHRIREQALAFRLAKPLPLERLQFLRRRAHDHVGGGDVFALVPIVTPR